MRLSILTALSIAASALHLSAATITRESVQDSAGPANISTAGTLRYSRNLIVNNVSFLVREAVRRPNLASKALAHSLRTLAAHWREHFGYEPLLCEPSGARLPADRLPRSAAEG